MWVAKEAAYQVRSRGDEPPLFGQSGKQGGMRELTEGTVWDARSGMAIGDSQLCL